MTPDEYLKALLSLPSLELPRVSKDGRWVAWTWYRTGPAADVYAAPTDGSAPPIRLTKTVQDTRLVSWYAITHFPPEIVSASAPICGMTDLAVDWETTRPDPRPYSEEMMGGSPEQVPGRYRARSPLHSVHEIRGWLLIIQGLQDPNVTPENVHIVREALDQAGIEYELLLFEDEGHGIHRPKNHQILYPRMTRFFEEAFAAAV